MKGKRQTVILDLISENIVETQEDLLRLLSEEGYAVTQATISRDIKELRLVKALSSDGRYHYATAAKPGQSDSKYNYDVLMNEALISVDYAMNMVCVKCHTGLAQAACEWFDNLSWNGVLGTLAGENTFFVLVRNEKTAEELTNELRRYIAKQ